MRRWSSFWSQDVFIFVAHTKVRQVVKDGVLADRLCPIRHILEQSPGKDVHFEVRLRRFIDHLSLRVDVAECVQQSDPEIL